MKIKEICNEIDLIIAGKDNKNNYKYIFFHLNDALTKDVSYEEIVRICETILKIAKTKNRILRFLEKDFWSFIKTIPILFFINQNIDINEDAEVDEDEVEVEVEVEELLPNTSYDNMHKKALSRILGFAQEILQLKDDNSKGSDLRRTGSLEILGELINYYHIPFVKNLLVNSISSKNKKEQYAALEGLEQYYEACEDDLDDDLLEILNSIKDETDDRTVASTCLQIQINAGIIDEMSALFEIDDWKDEHDY